MLEALRRSLERIDVGGTALGGPIPEGLYDCARLEHFRATGAPLVGRISPRISRLRRLRFWTSWGTRMEHEPSDFPAREIFGLEHIGIFQVSDGTAGGIITIVDLNARTPPLLPLGRPPLCGSSLVIVPYASCLHAQKG